MIAIRLWPLRRSEQVDLTISPAAQSTPVHVLMSSPPISISLQERLNPFPSVRSLVARQEDVQRTIH
jgi:hypothetical protein